MPKLIFLDAPQCYLGQNNLFRGIFTIFALKEVPPKASYPHQPSKQNLYRYIYMNIILKTDVGVVFCNFSRRAHYELYTQIVCGSALLLS